MIYSLLAIVIGSCQAIDEGSQSLQVTQLTHKQVPTLYLH